MNLQPPSLRFFHDLHLIPLDRQAQQHVLEASDQLLRYRLQLISSTPLGWIENLSWKDESTLQSILMQASDCDLLSELLGYRCLDRETCLAFMTTTILLSEERKVRLWYTLSLNINGALTLLEWKLREVSLNPQAPSSALLPDLAELKQQMQGHAEDGDADSDGETPMDAAEYWGTTSISSSNEDDKYDSQPKSSLNLETQQVDHLNPACRDDGLSDLEKSIDVQRPSEHRSVCHEQLINHITTTIWSLKQLALSHGIDAREFELIASSAQRTSG